jgi:heme exporter protein D
MEGRLQGGPRPSQRPPVRLTVVAAAVFVVALAASALISGNKVRQHVAQSVARDSRLTSAERKHAAGDRLGFDAAAFDAFRLQLQPRERYAVDVPPGAKGPFITRGAVVRAYAAFYFLPAIQVEQADHVFRYRFR